MKVSSVRRFFVSKVPGRLTSSEVDERVAAAYHRPIDPAGEEVVSSGWCSYEDERVGLPTHDANVVLLGFRVDTLKVPADLLKSRTRDAIERARDSGRPVDRLARKDIQAAMLAELRHEVPPKVTHVPVVWDQGEDVIYLLGGSDAVAASFHELLEQTLDVPVRPCAVRSLVERLGIDPKAVAKFGPFSAERAGGACAEPFPTEYMGQVSLLQHHGAGFLLWLSWGDGHSVTRSGASVECSPGDRTSLSKGNEVARLRGGNPTETRAFGALLIGEASVDTLGLVLTVGKLEYNLTLSWWLSAVGVKLPALVSDEPIARDLEQVRLLGEMHEAIDALFAEFLRARMAPGWFATHNSLWQWARELAGGPV